MSRLFIDPPNGARLEKPCLILHKGTLIEWVSEDKCRLYGDRGSARYTENQMPGADTKLIRVGSYTALFRLPWNPTKVGVRDLTDKTVVDDAWRRLDRALLEVEGPGDAGKPGIGGA